MDRAVLRASKEYLQNLELGEGIRGLIGQAYHDLYHGPVVDDPAYPGFETATQKISDALDGVLSDIYVEGWSGCCMTALPEPEEDEDGNIIEPDHSDYTLVEVSELKRLLVGNELAGYIQ